MEGGKKEEEPLETVEEALEDLASPITAAEMEEAHASQTELNQKVEQEIIEYWEGVGFSKIECFVGLQVCNFM